jgi:hypothetical protein
MGYIYSGVPTELVAQILKASNINSFVETGTSVGTTAMWASSHFKKVYTIEIVEEIYRKAMEREDAKSKTNIKFLQGSSLDVLPNILSLLEDNTMFWLDGHYSGFSTGGADNECPVLDEIKIISKCKDAAVLIDDARCFLGPPPSPHNPAHWPGIAEIFACLKQYFPQHYATIVDDVIICVPQSLKATLDKDWLGNMSSRYKGPPFSKRTMILFKRIFKKGRSIILNKPNY